MRKKLIMSGLSLVVMTIGATAQTTVTNNNNGNTNTVPVYTGGATLGNSPISVSGSNVGIGTASPNSQLDMESGWSNGFITLGNSGSGNFDAIRFQVGGADRWQFTKLSTAESGGNNGSDFELRNYGDNGVQIGTPIAITRSTGNVNIGNGALYSKYQGNVGIGTTSPAHSLDVAGLIHTSTAVVFPDGSQQTTAWTGTVCGGDYAESVDAAGKHNLYAPGDVLVLTSDGKGNVEKAPEPYSTMVAGIYATRPGVIGRRISLPKSADDVPMALIGIVPTKVSAENGSIRRGDLLVSSSTPGYAMKGTDRNRMLGAVVGKAMGSLESGKGVIEVLVTLQ